MEPDQQAKGSGLGMGWGRVPKGRGVSWAYPGRAGRAEQSVERCGRGSGLAGAVRSWGSIDLPRLRELRTK